jgi:hypothetical protein
VAAPHKLLIDECLRSDHLTSALRRFNELQPNQAIDFVNVGDPGSPPRSADDNAVLEWAILHTRMVVTLDRETFIGTYYQTVEHRVAPALLVVKAGRTAVEMAEWLAACCQALTDEEAISQVHFGPV